MTSPAQPGIGDAYKLHHVMGHDPQWGSGEVPLGDTDDGNGITPQYWRLFCAGYD